MVEVPFHNQLPITVTVYVPGSVIAFPCVEDIAAPPDLRRTDTLPCMVTVVN
jgi:hypothetical protein